jgi:hypothetical protein
MLSRVFQPVADPVEGYILFVFTFKTAGFTSHSTAPGFFVFCVLVFDGERYNWYVAAQSVIRLFSGEDDVDQFARFYPERRATAFEKTVLLYKMDIQIGPSDFSIRWNVTDSSYSF